MFNNSIYTIYKATNIINGKCYIGYTSKKLKRRIYDHHRKTFFTKNRNFLFHKAIYKYGKENFQWAILYQSNDMDFTKNIMESYMIKQHNSYYKWDNGGYNMTLGGEGYTGKMSEIAKLNMKNNHASKKPGYISPTLGYKHTEESIKIMREKSSGKKFSIETRKKLSMKLLGNTRAIGRKWYNNGIIEKMCHESSIPDDFFLGRIRWKT